jgi:phage-related protein
VAGEEEDYGSARITIDLDDAEATTDARDLGQRIQRALERSTRNIGRAIARNIRQGLRGVEAAVQVEPDVARFETALRAQLRGLDDVLVRVAPDAGRFASTLRQQVGDLELNIQVLPDLSRFDRGLLGGLRDLDGISIPILPDLSQFEARLLAGLSDIEAINIPVHPDMSGFDARIRAHNPPNIDVEVDADTDRLGRSLRALGRIAGRTVGALGGLLALGAVGIAAASAATAVGGLVAALAPTAGLIAAMPAAILGATAALGGLKLALSGVKEAFTAALTGTAEEFNKALEELSPKAQAAAREVRALKPAFEDLKTTVQDQFFAQIEGQITRTAQALSGPLKDGLTGISTSWGVAARNVLGYLQGAAGVSNVASIMAAAQAATEGFSQTTNKLTAGLLQVAAVISDRFGGELAAGISNLGQRFGEFLQRAAQGGDAVRWVDQALTAVAQLGDVLGNVGDIISGLFSAADASGSGFLANLQQITQAFSDFVNSTAGQEAIGNIFSTVGEIAAQLGPILSAVVTQIGAIVPALEPVFQAIGPAITGLIDALGPALAALAPSLQVVGDALAEAFALLGPALEPLGAAIGSVIEALSPLLPLVAQVVASLATVLAPVLESLAALFAPIIEAVADALMPILPPLAEAFAQVAEGIKPLAETLGTALGDALTRILPPILALAPQLAEQLAPAFVRVVEAVTPLIPPLIDLVVRAIEPLLPQLPRLVDLVGQMVTSFVKLLEAVMPLLPPVIKFVGAVLEFVSVNVVLPVLRTLIDLLSGLADALTWIVDKGAGAITFFRGLGDSLSGLWDDVSSGVSEGFDSVVNFFTGLPDQIGQWLDEATTQVGEFFTGLWDGATTALSEGWRAVTQWFSELPGEIMRALAALPGLLLDLFTSAVASIGIALATAIAGVVWAFTELPTRIWEALQGLGQTLWDAITGAWEWAKTALSTGFDAVVTFFSTLPTRIWEALQGLGQTLWDAITGAWEWAKTAVTTGIDAVVVFVQNLPSRAAAALSSLGTRLWEKITQAWESAKTAVTRGIESVVSFFRQLPRRAGDALSSLGSRLWDKIVEAGGRARRAASDLVAGVANVFSGLGGRISAALGNIGGTIMSKIKAGLPGSVRKYLPFARGGIVYGPTHALIGEAGPEVVIPLTKPKRAAQLAAQSGLLGILSAQTRALAAPATTTSASVGGAVSTLRTLLAGIGQLLDGVGANVVQGMVDGIQAGAGRIAAAAGEMANTAAVAARDTLEIHSPSKVFARIGREVGRGFIEGLTGTAAQIKSTTEKMVKSITDAFAGTRSKVDDRLVKMLDDGNKRLTKLAAERDDLVKRIADAQKFAADTTKQALAAFSLQNLTRSGEVTAKGLASGLEDALKQVRTFTANINTLSRKGLSKALLEQIVSLGPVQGAQLAESLAGSTRDSLKRLNSLQTDLTRASTSLGNTSADVLFDAGKQAGKGFLTGLQAQRKSIEKLMLDIAKGMQSAIRTALRIKSPSRVMRRLGEFTGMGLEVGLVARIAHILRAATASARAVVTAVAGQFDLLPGRVASSLGGVGDLGADVIPLTRAQRVRQAGPAPAGGGGGQAGASVVHNHHWDIREVGDATVTAQRVLNRFVHAAGVS